MLEYFVLAVFIILFIISLLRRGGLIYAFTNTLILLYAFAEGYSSVYFMLILLVIQYIIALALGEGELG